MEEELEKFLIEKCKFKDKNLDHVKKCLEEQMITDVDSLQCCDYDMLIEFKITQFQAKMIMKQIAPGDTPPPNGTSNSNTNDKKEEAEVVKYSPQENTAEMKSEEKSETKSSEDFAASIEEEEEKVPAKQKSEEEKKSTYQIQTGSGANKRKFIKKPNGKVEKNEIPPAEKLRKQSYLIYQSYVDFSAEYRMNKIKMNEEEYLSLIKDTQSEEVQVIGFYGDYQKCLNLATLYLGLGEKFISEEFEEGIITFTNNNKIAMIFKTQIDTYNYLKGSDSSNLCSTYLRYIIDICEVIVLATDDDFRLNPDLNNPFQETPNIGYQVQEVIQEPDDKVSIKEVPFAEEKFFYDYKQIKVTPDFSKYIANVEHHVEIQREIIQKDFYQSDLIKTTSYGNFRKQYTYEELKSLILEVWPKEATFFYEQWNTDKFYYKCKHTIEKFIKNENCDDFGKLVKLLFQEYRDQGTIIQQDLEKELQPQIQILYENVCRLIASSDCKNFQDFLEEKKNKKDEISDSTWFNQVKSFFKNYFEEFKCDKHCTTQNIDNIKFLLFSSHNLKEIDWQDFINYYKEEFKGQQQIQVHKKCKAKISDEFEILSKAILKLKLDERYARMCSLRQAILEKLFKTIETENWIMENRESIKRKVQIQFQALNIIRNTEHQIQNFILNKVAIPIYHQFGKESQGEIGLRSINFINDNCGLLLFQNFPEGKSSIFYFNFSSKSNIIVQHLLNLSSKEANLAIEPNLKLWCTYDNKEKRINLGKLTKDGKIEDGAPLSIYDNFSEGVNVEAIISLAFLPYGDRLLIINQSYDIFEYKWQSRQLNLILKKENKGGAGVEKKKITPTNADDRFSEILTSYDGKNIILRASSSIDIYDLNWDKTFSFSVDDKFVSVKTFSDKINNYITIFSQNKVQCFQLIGLTATKSLKSELIGQQTNKSQGNPVFDYIYQSFNKFGPHSSFLGCPSNTKICICFNNLDSKLKNNTQKYFQNLQMQNTNLQFIKVDQVQNGQFLMDSDSIMEKQKLKMILLGRIAIHIATIENFCLIPLQNGINISDQIAENLLVNKDNSVDLIEKIIQMIKFGVYEKALAEIKDKIYVVSVVGRQSSGKSYVMNRFFGTRFNVAATRCTDGIWMSIVEINENDKTKTFMVLDCEGLFSARRNDQEEMKLCLTLSAISDVMILNQDLAFNRHLNHLFNNFTKSIGRIKGKKLFKGYLMMLIRDVKSDEATGAYKELQSNLVQLQAQKQDTFLAAVFQGNLKSQCLNYFQQPIFNKEIEIVREKYFLALEKDRWMNGNDLAESLKITLAQVFLDDDSDMDIHKLKISCEKLFVEMIELFFAGGEKLKDCIQILEGIKIRTNTYQITIEQRLIKLAREDNDELDDKGSQQHLMTQEIIETFTSQSAEYSQIIHNDYILAFSQYIEELLTKRKDFILELFESLVSQDSEFIDIVKSYSYRLKNIFESYISKALLCNKVCRQCSRICTLQLNHKNNCNCETSHICEDICNRTQECFDNNYICVEVFGHEGDHRCNEGNHKCSYKCEINECKYLCSLEANHDASSQEHNCGNKHPCNKKCEDDFCTRTCQFDLSTVHTEHQCGEEKCIHKCTLCDRQCIFPHHFHQQLINNYEEENLIYSHEDEKHLLNYHICENEHLCKDQCTQKGVCQIDYKIEEKIWKNEFGEFPYPYFLPKNERNECKLMIPKLKKAHDEGHNCKIGEHRCFEQCPECKSFCNKAIDHEGFHKTSTHRNKENSVFVSSKGAKKVELLAEGKKREYKVGESCQPENCTTSCGRKGRAHYHLKECKDIKKCSELMGHFAKHSKESYHPFTDKVFDQWLCLNYWNSMLWEPPIEGGQLEESQQCNFVCCHTSHGDTMKFCNGTAWHDGSHIFDCDHKCYDSSTIDICFCMDTTGSMGSYIVKGKNTCQKIIKQVTDMSAGASARSINFGFVSYKDHPPQGNTYVTKVQPLCNEPKIISFINSLEASGGGDGPEAVLDGLYDSIYKIGWRKDSLRYLFHIADAPPHGKEYTGGSGGDGFPSGCPCMITIETIAAGLKEQKIRYKLMKIGSYPNTMASIFKSKIEDYEECDIDSAVQMEMKVSDIVVRDIKSDELDIMMSSD